MKNLKTSGPVMITGGSHELISTEKALVNLQEGCVWTYVVNNGDRVGVTFAGSGRLAVDAISETDAGAVGRSVVTRLEGIQFYLGETQIERLSREATNSELENLGYSGSEDFLGKVDSFIKDKVNGESKVNIENQDSSVLIGTGENENSIVLVAKEGKKDLVFSYGKNVYVVGDQEMVSVDKSGVRIEGKHGKTLSVTKDGISGLEGLENLGEVISEAVTSAMSGLASIKPIKSMKAVRSIPHAWDNVDDFDWDD
ncbi:MAG: hypothetical protein ACW975_06135 [Candidatus Thorarchaeota archaeon]|jgi:hypothetical protein